MYLHVGMSCELQVPVETRGVVSPGVKVTDNCKQTDGDAGH